MSQTPEQLEAEIEVQRARLAATVDALAGKLDVKSRAQDRAQDVKSRAQDIRSRTQDKVTDLTATLRNGATTDTGSPRPDLLAVAAAAAGLLVAMRVWRRRR